MQHLHATRQRLLRLHVVTVWGQKASAMASLSRVLEVSQQHSQALQEAADHLAHLHCELQPLLVRRTALGSGLGRTPPTLVLYTTLTINLFARQAEFYAKVPS